MFRRRHKLKSLILAYISGRYGNLSSQDVVLLLEKAISHDHAKWRVQLTALKKWQRKAPSRLRRRGKRPSKQGNHRVPSHQTKFSTDLDLKGPQAFHLPLRYPLGNRPTVPYFSSSRALANTISQFHRHPLDEEKLYLLHTRVHYTTTYNQPKRKKKLSHYSKGDAIYALEMSNIHV